MATINYSFNAVNGSGAYTIQVKNCAGTSTIYTSNVTGKPTTGTVTGVLTDVSLNADLGSIKLSIFDTNNNTIINSSGCFTHNCVSCVSITDFTLATTNNVNYGVNFDCTISGVNGDAPHSYYLTLKQNGVIKATNTNNSISNFTFTNNLCPNAGAITVEASVVNCGGTINKTNTITVNAVTPITPVLSVCYLGSSQWQFTALAGVFPESLLSLYTVSGDSFVGDFNPAVGGGILTVESPTINGQYYAKNTLCGIVSGSSNVVTVSLSNPSC